jgi:hypothetical protein
MESGEPPGRKVAAWVYMAYRCLHIVVPRREQFAVLCGGCACSVIPLLVQSNGGTGDVPPVLVAPLPGAKYTPVTPPPGGGSTACVKIGSLSYTELRDY